MKGQATPIVPRAGQVHNSLTSKLTACTVDDLLTRNMKEKKSRSVYRVTLLDVQDVVRRVCEERADDWAEEVRARILQVHDLPAADAIYHQSCSSNFRTKKQIPSTFSFEQPSTRKQKIGDPKTRQQIRHSAM